MNALLNVTLSSSPGVHSTDCANTGTYPFDNEKAETRHPRTLSAEAGVRRTQR